MKSGDIVLIRFPQTDLKPGKLRPALGIAISPSRYPDLITGFNFFSSLSSNARL
ncbi:MAG: hypothetical protein VKJ02_01030 [Snowella sp.]|nr:hypothetical protein [Snowella sp.]